jgi:hypothetical protein
MQVECGCGGSIRESRKREKSENAKMEQLIRKACSRKISTAALNDQALNGILEWYLLTEEILPSMLFRKQLQFLRFRPFALSRFQYRPHGTHWCW